MVWTKSFNERFRIAKSRSEYLEQCRGHVICSQRELRHFQLQYVRDDPDPQQRRDYEAVAKYVGRVNHLIGEGRLSGNLLRWPAEPRGCPVGAVVVYRDDDGFVMCGSSCIHPLDVSELKKRGLRVSKWEQASLAIRDAKRVPGTGKDGDWLEGRREGRSPARGLRAFAIAEELIERAMRNQRLFDEKQALAKGGR